ncbi:MAG: growth inhibitor PemK [Actinomyces sp.]|nr:MAG: growth inhibitor PemK [Actinomyces sp.]
MAPPLESVVQAAVSLITGLFRRDTGAQGAPSAPEPAGSATGRAPSAPTAPGRPAGSGNGPRPGAAPHRGPGDGPSGSHGTGSGAHDASGQPRPSTSIREASVADALAHASYTPVMDGDADPGEVVWTWVPYQEDASVGKDRPVVVIGADGPGVYVVQLTSKDHGLDAEQEARNGRFWLDIGSGAWDPKGRPSQVRLDRALWVLSTDVRREGAVLPRATWQRVVDAIDRHHRAH